VSFGAYFLSLKVCGGIFLAVVLLSLIYSYRLSRRSEAV
jgi:hypothetical protein